MSTIIGSKIKAPRVEVNGLNMFSRLGQNSQDLIELKIDLNRLNSVIINNC